MTVTAIVQARMGSTRLPGKALADLGGRPLLTFMLERLTSLHVDALVVATSDTPADDAIADVARGLGIDVVRGDEFDVLSRFVTALDAHPADHVVRLTADCPLADPDIINDAIGLHLRSDADYTSNSLLRTYPDGLDVEVIRSGALRQAAELAIDPIEREHATPFIYRRTKRFRLRALLATQRWGHLRWTIDTPDDLARVRTMVDRSGGHPPVSWLVLLDRAPEAERLPLRDGLLPIEPDAAATIGLPAGDPAQRTWQLVLDGRPVGWVSVGIIDGAGTVTAAVASEHRTQAMGHLREALRNDFQVVTLSGGLGLPTDPS